MRGEATVLHADLDAFYASVEHAEMASIGLNCATGPEFMADHLRTRLRAA